MPWTTYFETQVLGFLRGVNGLTIPASGIYVALLTALSNAKGGIFTEASYSGYARIQSDDWTNPAEAYEGGVRVVNTAELVFAAVAGGSPITFVGMALMDAASSGNCWATGLIGQSTPKVCVVTDETNDTFEHDAHGFQNDDIVRLVRTMASGGLPTSSPQLAEDTDYHVVEATTDSFKLAATQGGAAINISAGGEAKVIKYTPVSVAPDGIPRFPIGSAVFARGG